jgi:signal transduction histidine kinase
MSTDGIFHVDRNLKYQYANTAMSSMFGIHSGQHVDAMNSTVSMPKEMGIAWNNAIKLVFESGGEQSFEYRAMHGQRQYCFSAFIITEKGSGGNFDSALGIVYDVSRREKMEKEHEALLNREGSARIEAETAARARDEFLAIVSHELRAPLNGIQTWAHVLETIIRDTSIETASR